MRNMNFDRGAYCRKWDLYLHTSSLYDYKAKLI